MDHITGDLVSLKYTEHGFRKSWDRFRLQHNIAKTNIFSSSATKCGEIPLRSDDRLLRSLIPKIQAAARRLPVPATGSGL